MQRNFTRWSLAALTALTVSAAHPATQGYIFQTVDAPDLDPSVESIFHSNWRNNDGLIVQQYFGTDSAYFWGHTAVLDRGAWSVIDVPDSLWCGGSNPNELGEVALTYASGDGTVHLATWRGGEYTLLPDHSGYEMYARGINNLGQIAGFAFDAEGNEHGFVRDGEEIFFFDHPLASPGTAAMVMNDAGTVIGWFDAPDGTIQSFRLDGDQFETIAPPGSIFTFALTINNQGVIGGGYLDGDFFPHGFLLQQGTYTTFDFPGALKSKIDSVDERGRIAGGYIDFDGTAHGYVATPIHSH